MLPANNAPQKNGKDRQGSDCTDRGVDLIAAFRQNRALDQRTPVSPSPHSISGENIKR
jgi:hypothetical protein